MAESDEQREQEQQRQEEAEQAKKAIKGGLQERQGALQKKLGQATGSAKIEARGYRREARGRLQQGKTTQSAKRTSPETVANVIDEPGEEEEPLLP